MTEIPTRRTLWLAASVVPVLVTGCFRIGLDDRAADAGVDGGDADLEPDAPRDGGEDAGEDAGEDGGTDGSVDADAMVWPPALGPPVRLEEVSTSFTEMDPFLSADGLRLYFASDRPGSDGVDLWVASRTSPSGPFAAADRVAGVSSPDAEMGPTLSADELVLVFARATSSTGARDLFMASRPSPADPFAPPVPLDGVNGPTSDEDPDVSPDGLVLTFGSDRAGGPGGFDLWQASRRTRAEPFGDVTLLRGTAVGSASDERDPSLERVLLAFHRAEGGCGGAADLFIARRATADGAFDEAVCLAAVSSPEAEIDPCLRPVLGLLLFTRFPPGGDRDIWVARF